MIKYFIDFSWTKSGVMLHLFSIMSIGVVLYSGGSSYSNRETDYLLIQFRLWRLTTNIEIGVE